MEPPTVAQLNAAFGIESALLFEAGGGGLPRGVIDTLACQGEFYLHGAQVTRWHPAGEQDVVWLSPLAVFEESRVIRGGIPICFPWFGAHPDRPDAPFHGLARTRTWEVLATRLAGANVEVELGALIESWRCRLTASFGESLTVALEVRNEGDATRWFEAALHTYLGVSDVNAVSASGLEAVPFVDMAAGNVPRDAEGIPLRPAGELDRLYPGTTAPVRVHDAERVIEVDREGSRSTVIWNPGAEQEARLADLGDGWRRMLCVETANVRGDRVTLEGGETWTMSTTLRVSRARP